MSEFKADIFVHGLLPVALGFAGLMCFGFKALVPGLTCWAMAVGVFLVVGNKYGIDALGQIAAIDIIWTTIFAFLWGFFAIVGFGVRTTTQDLPSGDWRGRASGGGGNAPRRGPRYTVSGDPNEPPPPHPDTYRYGQTEIPQIAPNPNRPKKQSRFPKRPAKR